MQDLPPKSGTISHSSSLTAITILRQRDTPSANASLPRYRQGRYTPLLIGSPPVSSALLLPYSPPSKSFADVPATDAGVDTLAFLEACDGLVGLFGTSVLRCRGKHIQRLYSNPFRRGMHRTRRSLGFCRLLGRPGRSQGQHRRE